MTDSIYRACDDGTYKNPIIWADIPDPDIICVGDAYYMTSTTMYFNPGIPVMKSYDLVHWVIVNYVYDILDESDSNAMRNGKNAYGKGSWASCLRYNAGVYYVSVCSLNTEKTYIFQTDDIENGAWKRYELSGIYHDSSLLFDDDGRVYLVYGGGTIRAVELNKDATAILTGGYDGILIENADAGGSGGLPAEGTHIYKINGRYYIFLIAWPQTGTKRRIQLCYRSDSFEGPYEGRVVLDDDMGYANQGVAQGGIVDTPDGEWYAMLFQDHGAVGRIPVLVPVTWLDDFPVFGTNGSVPHFVKPVVDRVAEGEGIVASDEFDSKSDMLPPAWQFNHNPIRDCWSLTERPGFLRLKTADISKGLLDAHNTLTQRTFGPYCSGTVAIETQGMKDGDTAGLAALQELYGFVGVRCVNGKKYVVTERNETGKPRCEDIAELLQERVYFRVDFNFDGSDTARFYYSTSTDEINWHMAGKPLHMEYRLSHFTGYRFALFYYSTQAPGGYVDFDYFRMATGETNKTERTLP